MRFVMLGISMGLAGAVGAGQLLRRLLYGVGTIDAPTYASVGAILTAVAVAACYLPARRAATVDPMTILREE